MESVYKPAGYNSVSPYLIVDGAEATIEFLKRVFDAVELRRYNTETGKIMHAEIRIDDSVLMIADSNGDYPPVLYQIHIYVPDVQRIYERALDAGAESVQKPTKKDDPDKRAGVKDAGGTTWWIATTVE